MGRRAWAFRVSLAVLLGTATTVASAWAIALADIRLVGKTRASEQRILPTRGIPQAPYVSGVANGIGVQAFASRYRVVARATCYGPAYQSGAVSMVSSPRSTNSPPEAPDELVPRSVRPVAIPWLFGRAWPTGSNAECRDTDAAGWPWISMSSERNLTPDFTLELCSGIRVPWKTGVMMPPPLFGAPAAAPGALPLRPLWPGFAVDAGIFAMAWFGLLFVSGMIRRAFRRRRGRCSSCAYDLRGIPIGAPCPECGASQ
jgi:hypothetical protein